MRSGLIRISMFNSEKIQEIENRLSSLNTLVRGRDSKRDLFGLSWYTPEKECPYCGNMYKGKIGLGIHMSRMHEHS